MNELYRASQEKVEMLNQQLYERTTGLSPASEPLYTHYAKRTEFSSDVEQTHV